ncbi:unnamed protein product [Symbiodinium microadriaticum]|nr:unnamed protein product [Symbiodinium microadriaticum]
MDTVPRRRRGSAPTAGELEEEAAAHDQNYQAALSQAGGLQESSVGPRGGEASPGTLESGGAMGLTDPGNLPVANPFHSEKVKTEVQLLRHRPGSLDEDAAKIRTEVDESALGNASWTGGLGEPDYMSMMGPAGAASVDFPGSPDEGSLDARGSMGQSSVAGGPVPRVARVEPVEHGFASTEVRDGSWKHGRPTEEPQASGRAGHDATFEGVKEEPEAVGADDPRELIPAREDRLSRVEALLSQVLEENQALRRLAVDPSSVVAGFDVYRSGGTAAAKASAKGKAKAKVRTSDEWDCSHERYPELVRNQQQQGKPTGGVFLVFGPGGCSARLELQSQGEVAERQLILKRLTQEASGRDRGHGYKYFLAGAYTVPKKYTPEGTESISLEEYEPSECAELLPEESATAVELESIDELFKLPLPSEGSDARIMAVTTRVRGKQPEAEDPLEGDKPGEGSAGLSYRTLFLGVPLRSKKGREVLLQVQGLVNRISFKFHQEENLWGCPGLIPVQRLGLTKEELYASGAESLTVKVAITFAARHKHWKGVTIDVKSAFLYAPIRSDAKGTDERIVVKPPYLLVELGLLNKDDRWWVRKALYGLPTSPRDWGRYRDAEFQKVRITWQGCEYCLEQTKSDDALWLLRTLDANGMGSIEGVLVVYVDDLALFAPEGLAKEFIQAIQMRLLSGPSHVGGKLWVTFRVIQEDSIISLMGDNEAAIRIEAGLLHVSHLPGLAMLAAIPQVTGQPLQAKLIQEELRVGLTLGEVFPFLALAGMWSFSLWGLEKGDNGFRSQPRRF